MRVNDVELLHRAFAAHRRGDLATAEATYRAVLEREPLHASANHLLGMLLHQAGRHEPALAMLRLAVSLAHDSAEFQNSLGGVLSRLGRKAEALEHLRRAVAIDPRCADAQANLGLTLAQLGRHEEAVGPLRAAADLRPASHAAHLQLGKALRKAGQVQAAERAFRNAIVVFPPVRAPAALSPSAAAHHALASTLVDLGRADEAIESYRARVALEPHSPAAHSDLLFCMQYSQRYSAKQLLAEALEYGRKVEGLTLSGGRADIGPALRTAGYCAEELVRGADPTKHARGARATDDGHRRLRVGYLSPDFRRHTIRHIIEPILRAQDGEKFEVFCYASVHRPDDVTEKLRGLSEHWIDIASMSDEDAAQRIRDDGIDILVDLAGHMGDTRLPILARRPAPLQLHIGYPGTTGLSAVDYHVVDPHSAPPGTESHFTEKLLCLPHCAWPYQPPDDAPDVGPLPALANGYITFGCLNKLVKASRGALELWVKVLRAVPNSRLLLLSPTPNDLLLAFFDRAGIEPDRIELLPRRSRLKYLELFNRIDIALDPFPYNGETTTCDGLWMGVPLITLAGKLMISRRGVSHLMNLGLSSLIAKSLEEYVALAVKLSGDLDSLANLRARLRDRMTSSRITDGRNYTAELENAYRWAWAKAALSFS